MTTTAETPTEKPKRGKKGATGEVAPPAVTLIPWKPEKLPALNSDQAIKLHGVIQRTRTSTALLYYVMYKRRGFEKLGYDSFDQYCEQALGISKTTGYETVKRVETTLQIRGIPESSFNVDFDQLEQLAGEHTQFKLLPVMTTRMLTSLEGVKERQTAYYEAEQVAKKGLRQGVEVDPKNIDAALKGIVKRYLPPTPARQAPAPAPAPNAFERDASGQPPLPETEASEGAAYTEPYTIPDTGEVATATSGEPGVQWGVMRHYRATAAKYDAELNEWEITFAGDTEPAVVIVSADMLEV